MKAKTKLTGSKSKKKRKVPLWMSGEYSVVHGSETGVTMTSSTPMPPGGTRVTYVRGKGLIFTPIPKEPAEAKR